MELILLRHGKAEDSHPAGDAARRLVDKGHQQARGAAACLLAGDRLPDLVLTSPRVRARETAETFCRAAKMPGPVTEPWLNCGLTPDEARTQLVAFRDFERLMIVGHEPDFSSLVESWLGSTGGLVEVKKGALVGLEIHPPSGRAQLSFLIPPKLMGPF